MTFPLRRAAPLVLAGLALTAAPAGAGKPGTELAFPADLEMTQCWYTSTFDPGCPWTESILHEDGTWEHVVLHLPGLGDLPYTIFGTWELNKGGKELVIEYVDAYVTTTWTGRRTSAGCYEGDMVDTSGGAGVWEGCVVP